jgi:hypothetical protein
MYKVFECSPKAKEKIIASDKIDFDDVSLKKHHLKKYPVDLLKVGECFTVPWGEASEPSLRQTAAKQNKIGDKKFCVISHKDLKCFEFARIQ